MHTKLNWAPPALVVQKKKLKDKTKYRENAPSLEVLEVVLVEFNLVDNQYQQNSEVLYSFTPNKSFA